MLDILNIVLPTFIVIFVGYVFGRKTKVNMSGVVDIVIYIALPAMVFTSMLDKKIVLLDASKVWASTVMIMLGCGITAWVVFKILRQKHSGLYIPILVMNTVNIPFPIIYLASENWFTSNEMVEFSEEDLMDLVRGMADNPYNFEIWVSGYDTQDPNPTSDFTLFTWELENRDEGNMTVSPVTAGDPPIIEVDVNWDGLDPDENKYFGIIDHIVGGAPDREDKAKLIQIHIAP